MIKRWILGGLALLLAANVIFQMAAPLAWYDVVPGVKATGAFNPHFVRDIAAAYMAVVLGLGWFAWRPRQGWPALVGSALFLTVHAGIHVRDGACGSAPLDDFMRDFPAVYLPAILAVWVAVTSRPVAEAGLPA